MSKEAKEKPNYYAILPAVVRYDERLSSTEKLLYAELTALANKEGFAWAGNKYLAGLFGLDPRTITRIVTKLADLGLITAEYTTSNHRKVFIADMVGGVDKNVHRGIDKNVHRVSTKMSGPVDKNVQHNTKAKNNKELTISQRCQKRDLALALQKAVLEFGEAVEKICEGEVPLMPAERVTWYHYRAHLAGLGADWLKKGTAKLRELTTWRDSDDAETAKREGRELRTTTDMKRAFGAWMGRVAGYKKKDIA